MNRTAPALAALAVLTLAGCGSTAARPSAEVSSARALASNAAAAAASASAIAAAASASAAAASEAAPCTTSSCIVTDAGNLKGAVAKDNSVMTRITCKASTVKQVVSGTYTVHCTATYSDDSVVSGIASVLTGTGSVDWEPTGVISDGSGG